VSQTRSCLVTGASTGIGRAVALELADRGLTVYGGVRSDADAAALEAMGPVTALRLDVTDGAEVDSALARIGADGPLYGLVNNAGVYFGGALELMTDEEIERTFAVNVTGLLRVTRACLPMLRETAGRIVNVSSISGLVALPGVSVYAGSKHAVEAITDSLRVELHPFGIKVIAVEPGSIDTEIWRKAGARDAARGSRNEELLELYEPLQSLLEALNRNPQGIPARRVAEVVCRALLDASPDKRYLVGTDAKALSWLRLLPDALRDRLIRERLRRR
jgi:NAD(P)-dependent dehydrogenase (short-subunit alcohol dehydrogenase family)